jgi:hypothetical protein
MSPLAMADRVVRHLSTSLLCVIAAAALQAQTGTARATWPVARVPAELRDAVARADLVVISLQDTLQRELASALAQGGPAFAIRSCHIDVVGATRRVARQKDVVAGRTSDRLRNPSNRPPSWAAPLVAAHAGQTAREVEGFAVDLDDRVGVLRPIAHRAVCTPCHGAPERIDPSVHSALVARYPADRAVGFRDGEIRGWFWVEVPKYPR